MFLALLFAAVILAAVALKYLVPRRERCPQCYNVRDEGAPLCRECGWIYDVPGEEDDDYCASDDDYYASDDEPSVEDELPPELR